MPGVELPEMVRVAVEDVGECNVPAVMLMTLGVFAHQGRSDMAEGHRVWAGLVLVLCGRRCVAEAARETGLVESTLARRVEAFSAACAAVGVTLVKRAMAEGEQEATSDE